MGIKRPRVYISGPMSSLSRKEYLRRFRVADQMLKKHGYRTINPTRVWACRWPWLYKVVGYNLTLLFDLWLLMTRAEAIVMMPGWEASNGANIENFIAQRMYLQGIPFRVRDDIKEAINKNG